MVLDAAAVAAVSLSFPIMFLGMAVGGGLGIGGSVLVAQAIGAIIAYAWWRTESWKVQARGTIG